MKRTLVLLAAIFFALATQVAGKISYVTTGDKTYFSEDVKVGYTNVRITDENGIKLKMHLKNVDSYMIDGKLYDRLPLVCRNGNVKCTALLELVAFRNGLRLYKYYSEGTNDDLGCCFIDGSENQAMYFVYKDGNLYLRVDEKNAETVFPFFNMKLKS